MGQWLHRMVRPTTGIEARLRERLIDNALDHRHFHESTIRGCLLALRLH